MDAPLRCPRNDLIVVVDDNMGDLLLFQEAGVAAGVSVEVHLVRGGAAALAYAQEVKAGRTRSPSLIILDVNMPGTNGFDVLSAIKSDPALTSIPIFMLSSSRQEVDVSMAQTLGADGYLQKSLHFSEFIEEIRRLSHWLESLSAKPRTRTKRDSSNPCQPPLPTIRRPSGFLRHPNHSSRTNHPH